MSHLSIVALYGIFSSCVAFYWFSWDRSVALYWYRLLQKLCRLLLIFTCLGGILEVSPFIENITRPKTSQIVALSPCRGVAFYAGPFLSVAQTVCIQSPPVKKEEMTNFSTVNDTNLFNFSFQRVIRMTSRTWFEHRRRNCIGRQ